MSPDPCMSDIRATIETQQTSVSSPASSPPVLYLLWRHSNRKSDNSSYSQEPARSQPATTMKMEDLTVKTRDSLVTDSYYL